MENRYKISRCAGQTQCVVVVVVNGNGNEKPPRERVNWRKGEPHSTRQSGRESGTNSTNTNESNESDGQQKQQQQQQ